MKRLVQGLPAGDALYQTKQGVSPGGPPGLMNWYDFNLYGDPEVAIQIPPQENRAVFRGSATNNWIIDYNMGGSVDKRDHYGTSGDLPTAWD